MTPGQAHPESTTGATPRTHPAPRWHRALPPLVVVAGIAFTAWLLAHTRPGVFYSGDAGPKLLLVEQFARGDLHADLRLVAEPWTRELWDLGMYPFAAPFTYRVGPRTFAWCPLPFVALTAPAYALLGWRGLYLWPAIGLLCAWVALLRLCRKLDLGPTWTALALFAVVFCSPLTIYGAIFWEHTLGVALALGGMGLLAAPAMRSPTWNGLLGGLVLGLSVWLRSELVWLAAVIVALLPFAARIGIALRGRRAFVVGLLLAGAGLLALNTAAYGEPLGMHARTVVEDSQLSSHLKGFAWIAPALIKLLAARGPAIAVAGLAAIGMLWLRRGREAERGAVRFWCLAAAAFVLGVSLVLPNCAGGEGGKQFGPRYLLVVFPIASLILAVASRALWANAHSRMRAFIAVAISAGLLAGTWLNAVAGAKDLARDYASRIAPALEAARADPARVIVVPHHFVALELASLFASKSFLRADYDALIHVGLSLAEAGERRFLMVGYNPALNGAIPVPEAVGPFLLHVRLKGCFGDLYCLHEAQLSLASGP